MASEVLIKMSNTKTTIAKRFRGFFPVIIDIETAGFDASKDALLEIAAVTLTLNTENHWCIDEIIAKYIIPRITFKLDELSCINKFLTVLISSYYL